MSFTPPLQASTATSTTPHPSGLAGAAGASPLASSPLVSLLERITHPASLTDAQDRFLAVNPAFQRLFGYSSAEVIGLSPRLLIPTSVPEEQLQAIREQLVEKRQPWHGTLPHLRRNGETFDPRLHLLPLHPDYHLPPAGYIAVWAAPQDALSAILQLGTAFAAALLTAPPPASPPRSAQATLRRDEVTRLSALGFRNKEIARIMGIKASTVGVFKFQNRLRTQG